MRGAVSDKRAEDLCSKRQDICLTVVITVLLCGPKMYAHELWYTYLYLGNTKLAAEAETTREIETCEEFWVHVDGHGTGGSSATYTVKIYDGSTLIDSNSNVPASSSMNFETTFHVTCSSKPLVFTAGHHTIKAKAKVNNPTDYVWASPNGDACAVRVDSVGESATAICISESVTFTANPNPSGGSLTCLEWQSNYRPDSSSGWAGWSSPDPDENDESQNTITFSPSTAGQYQYQARNCTDASCTPCTWVQSLEVMVADVEITVDLEDPEVNGVRSGLDETTLRFELNGTVIPNSSLTLSRTTEMVDGEEILTELSITYVPSSSDLIMPGTNTVKVDIDDMVDNHMNQIVETFDIPS